MDVTPESNVRPMELHLTPPNIQNKCFSERSHLMFWSEASPGETGFIPLRQLGRKGYSIPCIEKNGWRSVYTFPAAIYLVEQSRLPELTENFILDEATGNTSLLREQYIQAERSEYTRFSMLEKR